MNAVIVCFTLLQQEEKDKAVSMNIKPYSWNEFLNMVYTLCLISTIEMLH